MRSMLALALCGSGCFYDSAPPLPADFGTCASTDDGSAGIAEPTWYRDVEPIVVAKCQGCHVEGGLAPFALASYRDMVEWPVEIHAAVESGEMPPWQPAACCNHYRWDRSLTDAERDTLLRWIDQGEAPGDPADELPSTPPPTGLPRVDLRATMTAPFTPAPKQGPNELRCFLLDHRAIDHAQYITGFDFKPGVRSEVHHVIAYAVDEATAQRLAAKDGADGRPGWNCYGQAGELDASTAFIGGWQPGVLPHALPDGVGRPLPAHSRIYVQIHYDTGHGVAPDQSAIEMMLADHVDRIEKGIPIGNPLWLVGDGMTIAPGDPDAKAWFAYDPTILSGGKPVDIVNVMVHMHEYGSIGRIAILHADGTAECLLDIPHWNFHWLSDYDLDTPARVAPGDQVYVECHWDNTAEHQPIINGEMQTPRTLHWSTGDEMCGAILTYSEAP